MWCEEEDGRVLCGIVCRGGSIHVSHMRTKLYKPTNDIDRYWLSPVWGQLSWAALTMKVNNAGGQWKLHQCAVISGTDMIHESQFWATAFMTTFQIWKCSWTRAVLRQGKMFVHQILYRSGISHCKCKQAWQAVKVPLTFSRWRFQMIWTTIYLATYFGFKMVTNRNKICQA